MFFKNATFFAFPSVINFEALEELLGLNAAKEPGPLEMLSRGFIPPFGADRPMAERLDGAILVSVLQVTKILPPAAINDKLEEKIKKIEETENRRPGGRERKRLKDDIIHELLPSALVKKTRINAIIDTKLNVLIVDTASHRNGEYVVSDIRSALGSFPAIPINPEVAPRSILTGWLAGKDLPDGFELGEACVLKDPAEGGAVATLKGQELRSAEIDKHLDAGKQATRLALYLEDNVAFALDDSCCLRGIKFLDGALESLEASDGEGRTAELISRFAINLGEIRGIYCRIHNALQFSSAEESASGHRPLHIIGLSEDLAKSQQEALQGAE